MVLAVIFDFNGVLVDDEMVHFALFRDVLAEEGIGLTEARYHADYLGYDDRGCFEHALTDAGRPADPGRVADLVARKAARYFGAAEAGLRYFPGAADVIRRLAVDRPLAIYSGALRPEIDWALGRLGVLDRFAAIISAEDTTRCKPDPQGYVLAIEALRPRTGPAGLAPGDCLVIEDSLAGVAAAKGAGALAVGVAQTYTEAELMGAGADATIDRLDQFTPDWIDRTFRP